MVAISLCSNRFLKDLHANAALEIAARFPPARARPICERLGFSFAWKEGLDGVSNVT